MGSCMLGSLQTLQRRLYKTHSLAFENLLDVQLVEDTISGFCESPCPAVSWGIFLTASRYSVGKTQSRPLPNAQSLAYLNGKGTA